MKFWIAISSHKKYMAFNLTATKYNRNFLI